MTNYLGWWHIACKEINAWRTLSVPIWRSGLAHGLLSDMSHDVMEETLLWLLGSIFQEEIDVTRRVLLEDTST